MAWASLPHTFWVKNALSESRIVHLALRATHPHKTYQTSVMFFPRMSATRAALLLSNCSLARLTPLSTLLLTTPRRRLSSGFAAPRPAPTASNLKSHALPSCAQTLILCRISIGALSWNPDFGSWIYDWDPRTFFLSAPSKLCNVTRAPRQTPVDPSSPIHGEQGPELSPQSV